MHSDSLSLLSGLPGLWRGPLLPQLWRHFLYLLDTTESKQMSYSQVSLGIARKGKSALGELQWGWGQNCNLIQDLTKAPEENRPGDSQAKP